MATIIVVTSGKGGVGKTTTAAAFGTGLALQGKRTVVVDFDVGLRNLDLIMGCERRVVFDLIDVINGDAKLNQALIKDKRVDGLQVLATSQTRDKDALTREGVEQVIDELKSDFDYIVCDSPAGIEHGAQTALYFADEAIVVTNPEVSSIRDSDRMVGILASKSRRAERNEDPVRSHVLITRYDPERVKRGEMLKVEDVIEMLALPLLGVIPELESVLQASNVGAPVVLDQESKAGQAYRDAVAPLSRPASRVSLRRCREEQRVWLWLLQPSVAEERVSIFQRSLRGSGVRLLSLFRAAPPRSADTAKERLQVLLALERSSTSAWPNFLPQLQKDIMQVDQEIRRDRRRQGLDRGGAGARGVDARHQRRAAGAAPGCAAAGG